MKIKVSKLEGPALDWAVAKSEYGRVSNTHYWVYIPGVRRGDFLIPDYDEWENGGPIIEQKKISVFSKLPGSVFPDAWIACMQDSPYWFGPTPLIAAMRCYVASKFGDEIDVPEELL